MGRIARIVKRDGTVVPFEKRRIVEAIYKAAYAVGGHDRSIAERLADQVMEMLEAALDPASPPSVEDVQDVVEKVLIENGHAKTAKAYILYRAERARERELKARRSGGGDLSSKDSIPYREIYRALVWNLDHECETLEKVAAHMKRGTFPELVAESERFYESQIDEAASCVLERAGKVRVVIIAGPSSSGKTTTTIKLGERLKARGLELVALNIDDYFFDLEVHPRDEHGDYDFETPQAIDLDLVNEHLAVLLDGGTAMIPRFDFKSGKRLPERVPMKLEDNQIILIDSLHGLYADMTKSVPDEAKFKLYIETLAQQRDSQGRFVRWTDIRLMRRMIRDGRQRSYGPVATVGHWHYVRRAELRYIVPYVKKVDFIVNSALPYEIPVLKKHCAPFFPEVLATYEGDEKKVDAAIRAGRVWNMLQEIPAWEDDSVIPRRSLMREFIGGSGYDYRV